MDRIPVALQPKALLMHPSALAKHFRNLIDSDASVENLNFMNSLILEQTHKEAIPSTVYYVWLCMVYRHSSHFLPSALQDETSAGVRSAGIKVTQRIFRSRDWKRHGWDALGGAEGIKTILDRLPLAQVRLLIGAISHCHSARDRQLMATCFDELVTLLEGSDSWTERCLLRYASRLYGKCSSRKAMEALKSSSPGFTGLSGYHAQLHMDLLRQIAIGTIDMPPHVRKETLTRFQSDLLHSWQAYDPIYVKGLPSDTFPGVAFGIDMLQLIAKDPRLQCGYTFGEYETSIWVRSVLKLAIRRCESFDVILLIITTEPVFSRSRQFDYVRPFLPERVIIQLWSLARFGSAGSSLSSFGDIIDELRMREACRPTVVHRAALEDCLIKHVIQAAAGDCALQPRHPEFTKKVARLLWLVASEGRFDFLQLLCRHLPTLRFDITAWPPSEEERQLVPTWGHAVLQRLSLDSSKSLFERSLHVFHCEEFLPDLDGTQRRCFPSWEEQCQLWADWESSAAKTVDDLRVTRKVIDEMKQRAMRGQQPHVRSSWAKSAISLAGRIQSLDIFSDLIEWSKRFLRDALAFPAILQHIIDAGRDILPCSTNSRLARVASKADLQVAVQKSHEVLDQVLEICLLLLREPGAQQLTATTRHVPELFSTIIRARMDAVTLGVYDGFASETELFEILLDSLIPIIIEYEREGNAQRQTAFGWSNPSGVIARVWCRDRPTLWELSWMDRLAEARDELWQDIRARNNPDILTLGPGWPRGLPIQKLVTSEEWIYHALEHPTEMPYLASRANEVLFSPVDTVMTLAPEKLSPVDGYVDYLGFAVEALIEHRTKGDRSQRVLRVWEHYSSALQPHPLYLELFQDWLASLSKGKVPDETVRLIRPAPTVSRPSIWSFSRGPEVTEWDPQGAVEEDVEIASGGDEEKPQRVPRTILNCRMCGRVEQSDTVPTRQDEPRKTPEYCSVWSLDCQFWREVPRVPLAVSRDSSVYIRELFMISALLFLDTFTKDPRILRERFPNVEHPRYTPTHLADEFLAREIKLGGTQGALQRAVTALEVCKKRVPAQLLRNIVCSFLDTLKAAPDASMYPILLTTTIKSFKILLETDQPHLAVDIALRVWQEFSDESSRHRALNLVTIGRTLLPHQASDMMRRFAEYVCSALQKQQQQQMEKAADKPLIKVTTAKMLAQALADADFLPQSTRMHLLQRMYDVSNHIDIRKEIFTSLLQLVSHGASAEPYRVFASIALSAAGPSERDSVTEADWDKAENGGALPPVVLESSSSSFSYYGIGDQRPILNLVVIDALSKIPETLRSDYVHKVLLPLVQESTRQHARWMTCLVTRLGLSLPDLGLTESDIGPFPPELVKTVLREWREFLPKTYLQIHRSWALSYLHHQSFTRISEALANTQDPNLRTPNVQDHWKEFLKSQRDKFLFYGISPRVYHPEETIPRELTDELMLEEYILRAEIVIKNPVRYRPQSSKYTLHAGYALDILRSLRRTRDAIYTADPARRQRLYAQLTRAMDRVAHVVESVRKEGTTTQSSTLDTYPVTLTLPTAFECEVLLLPSLEYDTAGVRAFVSRVIALIAKYADDPVLLLKLDAFDEVLRTVASNRQCLMTCALGLGRVCPSVEGQRGLVETCARVKLARRLLGYKQTGDGPGDKDVVDMVEEWKRSDVEIVRGIGWEWEWTDAQDRMKGGSVRANPQTR